MNQHSRWQADERLEALHQSCTQPRAAIEKSDWGGCFYGLQTFPPTASERWLRLEETALCPECGIDAVLSDSPDQDTLRAMHSHWFGES